MYLFRYGKDCVCATTIATMLSHPAIIPITTKAFNRMAYAVWTDDFYTTAILSHDCGPFVSYVSNCFCGGHSFTPRALLAMAKASVMVSSSSYARMSSRALR